MSLMHNIRNFAEHQLQGVIPWSKFSFPDEVKSDVANVSIEGKAGLYRITVTSSYASPPLGNVKFTDHASGHEIEGNNQDGTWHLIAEYLKARERNEFTPDEIALIKELPAGAPLVINKIAALPVNELPIPPVPMVWFVADPGVWYQNGPALVTRVNADGSYNLTVVPDGSEPLYRQNVRERSDGLRNVCWVRYESAPALMIAPADMHGVEIDYSPGGVTFLENPVGEEISKLREMIDGMQETISDLQDMCGRIKASAFDQRKSA